MFGQKKGKRLYRSASAEEEIELLDETFFSSDEENLIRRKRKRVLRILSSDSELETEEQGVSQSQEINGNEVTLAVSFEDISWSHQNLHPKIHNFNEKDSGCKAALDNMSELLDYFQLFFPESLVNFIVKETNNYHNYLKRKRNWKKNSRINSWYNTNTDEMYCFLGTVMLMSRVKKLSYPEYWSNDKFIKTDIFHHIMPRDRFLNLMQCLHFSNSEVSNCKDKLFKIRELNDRFRLCLKQNFYPYQNICIDESLLLFKGRLSFKQFIPSKRNRFGIKSFVACDCKTGYILDMLIYSGSETQISVFQENLGKSGNIVMTLMKDYLGKGHSLYVDNWYTSPVLFNTLHLNQTNSCGTVKKNRKYVPVIPNKLQTGEISFRSTETLLCMKWQDKREVWMLTSLHCADIVETGKHHYRTKLPIKKPTCIQDYNRYMGAVDKTDMVISTIECIRKSYKWYKKFFFHLLDVSIWNSYVLYKYVSNKELHFATFHSLLTKQIFKKYLRTSNMYHGKRNTDYPLRLIERHFPSTYFNPSSKKKNQVRKCVVCSRHKIRRESRYECKECDVGLCIDPCFRVYHTETDY